MNRHKGLSFLCAGLLLFMLGCDRQPSPSSSGTPSSDLSGERPSVIGSTVQREDVTNYGPREETVTVEQTPSNTIHLHEKGAVADGKTDCAPALKAAVEALPQGGFVYLAKGNYAIATDATVPESIVLVLAKGARLTIQPEATLTIHGFVDADVSKIFYGAGTLAGTIRGAGYPQWFGAVGTADDSFVFQMAIDHLQYMKVPAIGTENGQLAGVHPMEVSAYTVKELIIDHPLTIEGIGGVYAHFQLAEGGERLFTIQSDDVALKNLAFAGGADEKTTMVYFDNAEKDLSRISLSNVYGSKAGCFLRDAQTGGKNPISCVEMLDVRVDAASNVGIWMTDFTTGLKLVCVQVHNLGVSFKVKHPGIRIENCQDMYMADIDVTGGRLNGSGADALVFQNCQNVTLDRAMMEFTSGVGLKLVGCRGFSFNHFVTGPFDGEGMYLENCADSVFNITLVIGENYVGSATTPDKVGAEPATAVVLKGCKGITFNGLNVYRNFADALHLIDTTDTTFNALTISEAGGAGYVESGSSDRNVVLGASIDAVGGDNVVQVGKDSRMVQVMLKDKTMEADLTGSLTR